MHEAPDGVRTPLGGEDLEDWIRARGGDVREVSARAAGGGG
ncbi:hypothetical protein AB0P15_17475 [Streptomyces sp. NPDC087917]